MRSSPFLAVVALLAADVVAGIHIDSGFQENSSGNTKQKQGPEQPQSQQSQKRSPLCPVSFPKIKMLGLENGQTYLSTYILSYLVYTQELRIRKYIAIHFQVSRLIILVDTANLSKKSPDKSQRDAGPFINKRAASADDCTLMAMFKKYSRPYTPAQLAPKKVKQDRSLGKGLALIGRADRETSPEPLSARALSDYWQNQAQKEAIYKIINFVGRLINMICNIDYVIEHLSLAMTPICLIGPSLLTIGTGMDTLVKLDKGFPGNKITKNTVGQFFVGTKKPLSDEEQGLAIPAPPTKPKTPVPGKGKLLSGPPDPDEPLTRRPSIPDSEHIERGPVSAGGISDGNAMRPPSSHQSTASGSENGDSSAAVKYRPKSSSQSPTVESSATSAAAGNSKPTSVRVKRAMDPSKTMEEPFEYKNAEGKSFSLADLVKNEQETVKVPKDANQPGGALTFSFAPHPSTGEDMWIIRVDYPKA